MIAGCSLFLVSLGLALANLIVLIKPLRPDAEPCISSGINQILYSFLFLSTAAFCASVLTILSHIDSGIEVLHRLRRVSLGALGVCASMLATISILSTVLLFRGDFSVCVRIKTLYQVLLTDIFVVLITCVIPLLSLLALRLSGNADVVRVTIPATKSTRNALHSL
jgi:hypothetical protein